MPEIAGTTAGAEAMLRVSGEAADLLRGIRRTDVAGCGEWDLAELAVHMLHVLDFELGTARGDPVPPVHDFDDLAAFTRGYVAAEPSRDVQEVADRIEAAAAELVARTDGLGPDHGFPWLGETRMPLRAVFAHVISELLVHGADVARADGRPWPIRRVDALAAIDDFFVPLTAAVAEAGSFGGATAFVHPSVAAGFRAVYDVGLTGGPVRRFLFADGTLRITDPQPGGRVDCQVRADPAALLLVVWQRRSPWPAVLSGRLRAWGRRPWMAARLPGLFRIP